MPTKTLSAISSPVAAPLWCMSHSYLSVIGVCISCAWGVRVCVPHCIRIRIRTRIRIRIGISVCIRIHLEFYINS